VEGCAKKKSGEKNVQKKKGGVCTRGKNGTRKWTNAAEQKRFKRDTGNLAKKGGEGDGWGFLRAGHPT